MIRDTIYFNPGDTVFVPSLPYAPLMRITAMVNTKEKNSDYKGKEVQVIWFTKDEVLMTGIFNVKDLIRVRSKGTESMIWDPIIEQSYYRDKVTMDELHDESVDSIINPKYKTFDPYKDIN
jgi:hypothetical protein